MKNIYKIAEQKGIKIDSYEHPRIDNMKYTIPDKDLRKMSKEDLEKYIKACWCCGSYSAGGYDGWSRGHELLEELGFTKKTRTDGHRCFESMVRHFMNSNPTTLSVDERIEEILNTFGNSVLNESSWVSLGGETDGKGGEKAKQSIKSLIRQVCEEVIGQDDVYDETSCYDSGHYSGRQDLRDEQRTKLNKILEKGEL